MRKVFEKTYTLTHQGSGYKKKVALRKYELPSGLEDTFWVDEGKDSVQIFAITKNQEVVCVSQFRPGTEKVELELSGGGLNGDEDPQMAAARELLEETGYKGTLEGLGKMPYSPYSTGFRHMFLAKDCRKVAKQNLDPNEFLSVRLIPLEDFRALMKKGQVRGTDLAYMALDSLELL